MAECDAFLNSRFSEAEVVLHQGNPTASVHCVVVCLYRDATCVYSVGWLTYYPANPAQSSIAAFAGDLKQYWSNQTWERSYGEANPFDPDETTVLHVAIHRDGPVEATGPGQVGMKTYRIHFWHGSDAGVYVVPERCAFDIGYKAVTGGSGDRAYLIFLGTVYGV